jgi:cytochrome c peroxidase
MDIGTTNFDGAPDLPLFRITCEASGRVVHTQDPGRALISGKCADVGAIVVPQLRGLAARAPYFSNGSAQTLRNVVEFYDKRFGLRYTEQEKQDLVNFLSAL